MEEQTLEGAKDTLALRSDLHLARKLWHIATGVTGVWAYFRFDLGQEFTALVTFCVAIAGLLMDFTRLNFEQFNRFYIKYAGIVMRRSEANGFSGLPFYALGVSVSLYIFPEKLAVLSVLFLIFADPISSLIGIKYGRQKILPNKSLEGAIAGFVVCYLLTMGHGFVTVGNEPKLVVFAFIAGLIGMASELVSGLIEVDDNLTIPVLSGLGLTVLSSFLSVF